MDQAQENVCKRCQKNPSLIVVRTEPLCIDCLSRFVQTKVVKRLESFRVRNSSPDSPRTILLLLTFAPADITLLQILDSHLRRQRERTSRTGFELRLLHVDASALTAKQKHVPPAALDALRVQFTEYPFTALDLADSVTESDLAALSAHISPRVTSPPPTDNNHTPPPPARLAEHLSALPSATSHADVLSILTDRVTARHARSHGCEALFATHTTTALAARTLAETAKGRGVQMPALLADGGVAAGGEGGGLPTYYPLRDLLGREVDAYASAALPPAMRELVFAAPPAAAAAVGGEGSVRKTTTIDELMAGYFAGVEEQYPGIVANVVRTAGKLQELEVEAEDQRGACELCSARVSLGGFGIYGWGGDQKDTPSEARAENGLCYGCARTVKG